jgi:hypothetical protein
MYSEKPSDRILAEQKIFEEDGIQSIIDKF